MAFQNYTINKDTPTILHDQIRQIVLKEIESGNVGVDEAIPTEEELCEMYGVSRTTVRRAISDLVKDGRLFRMKSKGTFVMAPKPVRNSELNVYYDSSVNHVKSAMLSEHFTLRSVEVVPSPEEVAEFFQMKAGDPVILIRRYQQGGGENILCCLECYLSYPACDFVFQELNEVAQGAIHPYLARHSGCFIDDYLVRMTAYNATSDEGLLKASKGDVICKIVSSGYAEETKKPIYYEITKYISERMNFILHYHN